MTKRNVQLRLVELTGEMARIQYAFRTKVCKLAANIAHAIPTAHGKEKGQGLRPRDYLSPARISFVVILCVLLELSPSRQARRYTVIHMCHSYSADTPHSFVFFFSKQ